MKFKSYLLSFLFASLLILSSCDDKSELTKPSTVTQPEEETKLPVNVVPDFPPGTVVVPSINPTPTSICGQALTVTLWAGQTTSSGTINISNDGSFLYITYNVKPPVYTIETHVDISINGFTERGAPGRYAYKTMHSIGTQTFTYKIPLTWQPGTTIAILAHTALSNGETAYGGTITKPAHGAWYGTCSYTIKSCTTSVKESCTLSQGYYFGGQFFTAEGVVKKNWPGGGTVTIGGQVYTMLEAKAIWELKGDNSKVFSQSVAIELSKSTITSGAKVWPCFNTISLYLSTLPKLTPKYVKSVAWPKEVSNGAGCIGSWVDEHLCQ